MDGFQKIELSSPVPENTQPKAAVEPEIAPKKRFRFIPRFKSRKSRIALIVLVLFVVLIVIPSILTALSAKKTYAQVQETMAALKSQDIELTAKELKETRESLKGTQRMMNLLFVARFIPGVHIYYNDAQHLTKAGFHGIDAAETFIESIAPYADVLGLKGQGSFSGGSAEQRIETAVKTMDKVTPKMDDIVEDLKLAQAEIENVDPNNYPSFIAGGKVKDGMITLRTLADDGIAFVDEARPLIKQLPRLLGEPDEKKYLVLFQNDKELRPTGGFITAYSIFRFDKGIIHVDESEDIYRLDDTISGKEEAPDVIQTYLKVPRLNLRDSNLSPDFPTSMEKFNEMYEEAGGYKNVDGVIAVDTHALVAAMNILGDITVNGKVYNTKIDPRCNCPQVIYELEDYSSRPVNYVRTERKGLIGALMYEIMNKAFSSSPKQYWGPLMQTMFDQIAKKHILFELEDKEAQKGLLALNAAGQIKKFDGDYLHINEANFGGAKSNLFVDQNVTQDYKVGKNGEITKTVTINYKNPFKPSDCNLERGGLCLNAPFKDWIRIYVPEGSKLVDSKGSEVKMKTYKDLGKTVFEGVVTVRPQGIGRLSITYTIPVKPEKGTLPVMVQKQPGTENDEHTITVNGKTVDKFMLETDKTIKLEI